MKVTNEKNELNGTKANVLDDFCDNKLTGNLCPITDIIDRISDKWSVHTIIMLGKTDKLRFGELKNSIYGISQRMLTVTLKNLERDGLVLRKAYQQIPPKVEYSLTDTGKGLLEQLVLLSKWATINMNAIMHCRKEYTLKNKELEPNNQFTL